MANTLNEKKDMLLECVRSGLPYDRALILCEFSAKQIERLTADKSFQQRVKFIEIQEEQELLKKHDRAIEQGIKLGSSRGIEWRLGKLNPKHWGDQKEDNTQQTINIIISEEDQGLV